MRNTFYFGIFLLFATIAMIVIGIIKGYLGFGFFIFPVVYGSGLYAALAAIALIFSILIIFLSMFENTSNTKVDFGGVVLIGPVPIIFGNSKVTIILSIIGTIILIILVLFLYIIIYIK